MNVVFTIIVFCRYRTNLFFHRTEECRKQENFDGTRKYVYVSICICVGKKKNNYPRNLLLDLAIYGSVVTSSCNDDISHFSDVKRDKYVFRLSCVRKKRYKLPQKRKVSFGCRLVTHSKDKAKACKSRDIYIYI